MKIEADIKQETGQIFKAVSGILSTFSFHPKTPLEIQTILETQERTLFYPPPGHEFPTVHTVSDRDGENLIIKQKYIGVEYLFSRNHLLSVRRIGGDEKHYFIYITNNSDRYTSYFNVYSEGNINLRKVTTGGNGRVLLRETNDIFFGESAYGFLEIRKNLFDAVNNILSKINPKISNPLPADPLAAPRFP